MYDFPNTPTTNQVVIGPNGTQYRWDGIKWITPPGTPYLPLTGGTLTGPLTLSADPASALQPVTLQYFNSHILAVPVTVPNGGTGATTFPITQPTGVGLTYVFPLANGTNALVPSGFATGVVGSFGGSNVTLANAHTATGVGQGPYIFFMRADGSNAAPSAIQLNDELGSLEWTGYGTTGFSNTSGSAIRCLATQTWTDTVQGSALSFWASANNQTNSAERMRLDGLGNLTLYNNATFPTTNPNGHNFIHYGSDTIAGNTRINMGANAAIAANLINATSWRGTLAAPTASLSGDLLLEVAGYGTPSAGGFIGIDMYASENWSGTANGSYMVFSTTAPGAVSGVGRVQIRQGVMIGAITADGGAGTLRVSQNTANPSGTLPGGTVNVYGADAAVASLFVVGSTPQIAQCSFGGTLAAPTATPSGNWLGLLDGYGYTGTGAVLGTRIVSLAAEVWTTAHTGTYLSFQTTLVGSTGGPGERVRLGGGLMVGSTSDPGAGAIRVGGSNCGYMFEDETTATNVWEWYSLSNIARLWTNIAPAGDKLRLDGSGNLTVVGNLSVGTITSNGITATGGIQSNGVNAGLYFQEEDATTNLWGWYGSAALAHLWLQGTGDRLTVDHGGNMRVTGNIGIGQAPNTGATSYSIIAQRYYHQVPGSPVASMTATWATAAPATMGICDSGANYGMWLNLGGTLATTNGSFDGNFTMSSNLSVNGGILSFGNAASNWIDFGTNGVNPPALTTRSTGTKLILYNSLSSTQADFAIGISSGTLWQSVGFNSSQFQWYGGTSVAATLGGDGTFTANSTINTYGDFMLARQTNSTGYLIRPNVAGYKNLAFAVAGAGPLDTFNVNSVAATFSGNVTIQGTTGLTVSPNGVLSSGSNAGLLFTDRSVTTNQWQWYAVGGATTAAYLWFNGNGNRFWVDSTGNIFANGNLFLNNNATACMSCSGTYTVINSPTNNTNVFFGGNADATSYFRNTTHLIQNLAGSATYFQVNGTSPYTYNPTGSWGVISGRAVKTDIVSYSRGLNEILALAPIAFRYNERSPWGVDDQVHYGFLAEDMAEVMPELVGETIMGTDIYPTVQPGLVLYAVINAIKELAAEVAELRSRLH